MRIINIILFVLLFVAFSNCKKEEIEEIDKIKTLSISITSKNISEVGETFSVNIKSNTNWSINSNEDWCQVDNISGNNDMTINITVQGNETFIERTAIITVSGTDVNPVILTIIQSENNYITINSPTNFSNWQTCQSYRIKWDDNISENVIIELYKGTSFVEIISINTPSDSLYIWSLPESLSNGSDYLVKITSVTDNNISCTSDYFTITSGNPNIVIDYDGNEYNIVQIGNQTWTVENLKVTHYPDGTPIPLVTENTIWGNLEDNNTDDAYCFYNNDPNSEYGALYTWSAAMGDNAVSSYTNPSGVQGVCPDGWHLPSFTEWIELSAYLGGSTIAGGKMKEIGSAHWNSPNTGADNSSGFTALPGGGRKSDDGTFHSLGSYGGWWSTHVDGNSIIYNFLSYKNSEIIFLGCKKSNGYSVRCIKD